MCVLNEAFLSQFAGAGNCPRFDLILPNQIKRRMNWMDWMDEKTHARHSPLGYYLDKVSASDPLVLLHGKKNISPVEKIFQLELGNLIITILPIDEPTNE